MDNSKSQHLEFIQNVITRMNANSFQIKSLTIMIVTALMGIYATTLNKFFILLGIFPTLIFWFLDTYYLQQERKFRGVYNDVAGITTEIKEIKLYEMPIHKYTKDVHERYSFLNVFFSPTIKSFYLPIIILLGAVFLAIMKYPLILK